MEPECQILSLTNQIINARQQGQDTTEMEQNLEQHITHLKKVIDNVPDENRSIKELNKIERDLTQELLNKNRVIDRFQKRSLEAEVDKMKDVVS